MSASRIAPACSLALSRRRSDKGGRHKQPEAKLQVACVKWAREERGLLVVGQAGGVAYLFGGRTANAFKAKGVEPGVPDLLILEAGADGTHGLAVELNIDDNELDRVRGVVRDALVNSS